jgi:hypothetical protein
MEFTHIGMIRRLGRESGEIGTWVEEEVVDMDLWDVVVQLLTHQECTDRQKLENKFRNNSLLYGKLSSS